MAPTNFARDIRSEREIEWNTKVMKDSDELNGAHSIHLQRTIHERKAQTMHTSVTIRVHQHDIEIMAVNPNKLKCMWRPSERARRSIEHRKKVRVRGHGKKYRFYNETASELTQQQQQPTTANNNMQAFS